MSVLKRGMKGVPVKRLQERLDVAADGDFGPGTERAVKEFQQANGLAVDGIAGPDTFTAMGLHELVLLRVGTRGEAVKKLQEGLGISADGIFGNGTAAAVRKFQEENGLVVDGLAGPNTLAKLNTFAEVITEDVVKKAEVRADEAEIEGDPMPKVDGAKVVNETAEEEAPKKSIWGRVKGWF